jgi:hypothetical protein
MAFENASSASERGSLRCCSSSASRSCRSRWNSSSGSDGSVSTRASTAIASGRRDDSVVSFTTLASQSAPASSVLPIDSTRSASAAPLSVPVPSVSRLAVSCATPSCPAGSATDPASTSARTVTSGSLRTGAITTRNPFGSTWRENDGNV